MTERHIGFTGTRHGMTEAQERQVARILSGRSGSWLHHGDCVGSDAQAHALARAAWLWVVVHPPRNAGLRAHCLGDVVLEPLGYLERGRAIVDACVGLIATPRGMAEEQRSGTWATIRYAGSTGKPVVVVWADGRRETMRGR